MKKPRLQQRGERRIAAALRIALAAALLAVQVLFVVLTTRYLKDHFALIYGALEGIALITALYIYNKPGDLSYRVAWIIPILFVPVVGLILYLLWGGDTQRKRLQRQTAPKLPPEEPESLRNRSAQRGPSAARAARLVACISISEQPRLLPLSEHKDGLSSRGGRCCWRIFSVASKRRSASSSWSILSSPRESSGTA
ncbi:MAG: PLD nuclease N-terminal domain-containing protein [Oscillospiraceae bacterium]